MIRVLQTSSDEVSLLALHQYLRHVYWMPYLTQEEEVRLVVAVERGKQERMKAVPDGRVLAEAERARDRLVEGFQGLVISLARRFVHRFRQFELMDVIQEANLGLLHAIECNDPTKGFSLAPLASFCIRRALIDAWYRHDGVIAVSSYDREGLGVLRRVRQAWEEQQHEDPTVQQLAQAAAMDEGRVYDLLLLESWQHVESFQAWCERDEAREEDRVVMRGLFEATETEASRQAARVREAMERALTPRQREVVELRYGLGEEGALTQDEVAHRLGIGQNVVSSIERNALRNLRRALVDVLTLAAGERDEAEMQVCEECGEAFPRTHMAGRYCSHSCQYKAWWRTSGKAQRQARRKQQEAA